MRVTKKTSTDLAKEAKKSNKMHFSLDNFVELPDTNTQPLLRTCVCIPEMDHNALKQFKTPRELREGLTVQQGPSQGVEKTWVILEAGDI